MSCCVHHSRASYDHMGGERQTTPSAHISPVHHGHIPHASTDSSSPEITNTRSLLLSSSWIVWRRSTAKASAFKIMWWKRCYIFKCYFSLNFLIGKQMSVHKIMKRYLISPALLYWSTEAQQVFQVHWYLLVQLFTVHGNQVTVGIVLW